MKETGRREGRREGGKRGEGESIYLQKRAWATEASVVISQHAQGEHGGDERTREAVVLHPCRLSWPSMGLAELGRKPEGSWEPMRLGKEKDKGSWWTLRAGLLGETKGRKKSLRNCLHGRKIKTSRFWKWASYKRMSLWLGFGSAVQKPKQNEVMTGKIFPSL